MEFQKKILFLLDRYIANECSDNELEELAEYIHSDNYNDIIESHILATLNNSSVKGENLEVGRSASIIKNIIAAEAFNQGIVKSIGQKRRVQYLAVAAAITIFLLSVFFIASKHTVAKNIAVVNSLQKNSQRIENNTLTAKTIHLQDGSLIVLQPSAALTYPINFSGSKREVLLEGDAFFDIAKDPQKPFLVYHGALITKVLGTSFNIQYQQQQKKAAVEVIRGKVEVYENASLVSNSKNDNGVIITPNQKVVYTEQNEAFSLSLVDKPVPIKNDSISEEILFNIKDNDLGTIIKTLQGVYGIEIETEYKNLNNCRFSGNIVNLDLFEKVNAICQAIGIHYQVIGTRIVLTGKGCE